MANEKFIVTTNENQFQINIRNLLSPSGYLFLINCNDAVSLMRMIRTYGPDFVIIDSKCINGELNRAIETIDEELLCPVIIIGNMLGFSIDELVDRLMSVSVCENDKDKDILVNTIDLSLLNFKRVQILKTNLKSMTENYETRKLVDRAKGILMEQNNISEKEAYDRMRKKSMNTRISMKQIAEAIIYTNDLKSGK